MPLLYYSEPSECEYLMCCFVPLFKQQIRNSSVRSLHSLVKVTVALGNVLPQLQQLVLELQSNKISIKEKKISTTQLAATD